MSDEHTNAFSAQLRRLRLAAGLTQEELAAMVDTLAGTGEPDVTRCF